MFPAFTKDQYICVQHDKMEEMSFKGVFFTIYQLKTLSSSILMVKETCIPLRTFGCYSLSNLIIQIQKASTKWIVNTCVSTQDNIVIISGSNIFAIYVKVSMVHLSLILIR